MGRWGLWALPVVFVAACTGAHHAAAHSQPPSASPSPRGLTVRRVALPPERTIAAWQLHGFTFTTGSRTQAQLDVGKSIVGSPGDELRQIALVFPAPRLASSCVASAALELSLAGGRHLDQAEFGVYASDESNYLGFAHAPNPNLDLSKLIDNRPRGYAADVTSPGLRIDVAALYRAWAAGGPFPSQGATVKSSWPFGVIVRPPTAATGSWDAFIHNGKDTPALQLSRVASCPSSGH